MADTPQKPSNPMIGSFKDQPLLILNPESKYPFSFGLAKARMILENVEALKAFVESNGTSCQTTDLT
jgi:hypothetical protein